MEKENRISVWVGKFSNETSLMNYLAETYDDDGEMSSKFMKDFDIDYYNIDSSEYFFKENIDKSDFIDFSYSESFLDIVFAKISNQNSFIIIYDFEYDGNITSLNNGFEFLGSFDYVIS